MLMKKVIILLLFFVFIYSATALTVETNPSYQPKETLIIEIAGNILEPIQPEDVLFKDNNVNVPIQFDIKNLGGRYFLYAVMPDEEGNYSLILEDVATTVNGIPAIIDFTINITVLGDIIPYTLNPGFFITQQETAEFNIFLNRDIPETISISGDSEITLEPGENDIEISLLDYGTGLSFTTIGIYEVPILYLGDETPPENLPLIRFVPVTLESTVIYEEGLFFEIIIVNDGIEPINDVTFNYDNSLYLLEPQGFEVIEAGTSETIIMTVLSENPFDDKIILNSGAYRSEMDVRIIYTTDEDQVNIPHQNQDFSETQQYYCSQQSGKICTGGDVCSIATNEARDTLFCCKGICVNPDEGNGTDLKFIGYLLLILIVLIVGAISYRFYKTKKMRKRRTQSNKPRTISQNRVPRPPPSPPKFKL